MAELLPLLHALLDGDAQAALPTLHSLCTTPTSSNDATWQLLPRCRAHLKRLPGKSLAAAQLGGQLLAGAPDTPQCGLLSADVTRRLVALPPTGDHVRNVPTVGVWAVAADVEDPASVPALPALVTWYVLNTWLTDPVFQLGGSFLVMLLASKAATKVPGTEPLSGALGPRRRSSLQCY